MTAGRGPDEITVDLGSAGAVTGLLVVPPGARATFVLAHGAGAGMRHPFLEGASTALADVGIATLRYHFSYMERGRRRPDPPAALQKVVRAALRFAADEGLPPPVVAGGKSLGGRMTSHVAATDPPLALRGLAFLGYPLHAPNRPGDARAKHLSYVQLPMLFLQGTRDALADLDLMRGVCRDLGPRATLHVVEGGDHSFKVPKRSGRTERDVMEEIAGAVGRWVEDVS